MTIHWLKFQITDAIQYRWEGGAWRYLWWINYVCLDKKPGYISVQKHWWFFFFICLDNLPYQFPFLPWCMWLVANKWLLLCCNTVLIGQVLCKRSLPFHNKKIWIWGLGVQWFELYQSDRFRYLKGCSVPSQNLWWPGPVDIAHFNESSLKFNMW